MKKILFLVFVALCGVIFYQIILGQNGLIEGYRVDKEKEALYQYKLALQKEKKELQDYIYQLKNNPETALALANKLGYFVNPELNLIKIIDEIDGAVKISDGQKRREEIEKLWNEIKSGSQIEKKISNLKNWTRIVFFAFFGMFVLLIIFSGQKNE
ncbi:MAG: septum formation initiator family protein [Spirochaetes bacterium]|nr:septum formation initiator family protein [Spirochaetota bacterium]